jgi:Zn-dependent protease
VARIFGIDIMLHWSWFIIFSLVVFSLAERYFPEEIPGASKEMFWIFGILTAFIFFCSLIFHELSHSLVARLFGISVRRITLFILGGAAYIEQDPPSPKAEFLMASAGPASSFFLAGTFWSLGYLGQGILPQIILLSLSYLSFINILLAGFNLIPGFPLDGGRILRAGIWALSKKQNQSLIISCQIGRGIAYLFGVVGLLLIVFTGSLGSGIWLGLIGLFLYTTASVGLRYYQTKERLSGIKIQEIAEKLSFSMLVYRKADLPKTPEIFCYPEESAWEALERMEKENRDSLFIFDSGELVKKLDKSVIIRYSQSRQKK